VGGFTVCLLIFSSVGVAKPNDPVAGNVLVAFMIFYNIRFQLSLGLIASMMDSESASTRLRSKAQSVTVFTAWAEAPMWTAVLPYLINPDAANIAAKVRFMYGGFGVIIFAFIFFCVPEYQNRFLEELDEMFMKRVSTRKFSSFVCNGTIEGHIVDETIDRMNNETKPIGVMHVEESV
jgi:hypothetical protein